MTASVSNAAVLTSWKEIARYMGKGVRTVQRWEVDFGLPVRRPNGANKKAILARPSDLDAWIAMRCSVSRRSLEKQSALSVRTSLSAELETARLLRESQRELRAELHAEIAALKARVVSIWQQECRMQNGLVEALWQGVDPALQPASSRAADEVVIPFQQPVRDEMGPIPASDGVLREMPRGEDASTLRFPNAMGA
jgi:hypothetical protein